MRSPGALFWIGLAGVLAAGSASAEEQMESPRDAPVQDNDGDILLTLQHQALPDLIHSLAPPTASKRLRLIGVFGGVHDARATAYLLQGYQQSPSNGIRCKLLESLGKLRDPTLFTFFVDKSEDPNIGIQCYAIWALGELRSAKAIDVLRPKLSSPDVYVQMTTIDALGKTGRNHDVSYALIVFLHDADVQRRYLAAKALEGAGGPEDVGELFSILSDEQSLDVQEALAETLGVIGGAESVRRFIDLLNSPLSPDKQHLAEVGLKSADPGPVVSALTPMLEGDDVALKISALHALGKLDAVSTSGQEPWIKQLRAWTTARDPELKETARHLLDKIRPTDRTETPSHD